MRYKIIFLVVVGLLDNWLLTNFINGEHIFPGPQALPWKHNGCGSPFHCFVMALPVVLLFRNLLGQRNIGPTTPARTAPTTPARTTPTTPARTTPTTPARTTPTTPARTSPTTLAPITTTPAPACPAKYSLYETPCETFCYRYELSVCRSWLSGRLDCQEDAGDLLVPTECNYKFFREQAIQNKERCGGDVWLGVVRDIFGGDYAKVRGDPFPNTFPFWGPNQPTIGGVPTEVQMSRDLGHMMRVVDGERFVAYICQIFI